MQLDLGNSLEKSSYEKKWLIEFLLVISFGGLYFNFDAPIALHQALKIYFEDDPVVGVNFIVYFNRLYGALAWSGIFMPFLIGFASDKFGNRMPLLFLTFCCLVGQFTMWIGCIQKSIWTMIAGRGISGIGIACILSLASKFITPYFKGKSLAFILSLNLSIGCLFDSINVLIGPILADSYSLPFSYFIGFLVSGVSVVAQFFCNILDMKADDHAFRRSFIIEKEGGSQLEYLENITFWEKIKKIPFSFVLIATYFFVFFSAYLSCAANFIPLSISILYGNLGLIPLSHEQAQQLETYAFLALLMPTFMLPVFGFLIDKYGGNIEVALISTFFCSMSMFLCYNIHPLILALIMGFGFSLILSSLWGCIAQIVNPQQLGMCYGIVVSLKFFGISIFTIITGMIAQNDKDEPQQYKSATILFGSLIALGIPIILAFRYQCIKNNLLNQDAFGNFHIKKQIFSKDIQNPSNFSILSDEK